MNDTGNRQVPAQGAPRLGRLQRSILSNWSGLAVTLIVSFFLSPFLVHRLGDSAYGLWLLMMSLSGYLGLLDLGVRNAVTRYVAEFHTSSDHARAGGVVTSALYIFIAAGFLASLFSLALALWGLGSFQIPAENQGAARFVLSLAGLNVALSLIGGIFGGVLAGLQRFDLFNAILILGTVVRTAAIVVALRGGRGLIALVLIHLGASFLGLLANTWVSLREYPELHVFRHLPLRQDLYLVVSFSIYSFLLDIFLRLIYLSDSLVIGFFLPVSMITFFGIAGNLMSYVRELIAGIAYTMIPLSSSLMARGQPGEVRRVTLQGARFATMVMLPIGLTCMLRGKTFIRLWMGPLYAELSGEVLWALSLAMLFAAANQIPAATLRGISQHKSMLPLLLAEGLCNLALSVALVRTFGVVGVAWGTAIPSLAVSLLIWPFFLQRRLEIPVREYFGSAWLRPAVAAVPFALGTLALERFLPPSNLFLYFLQVGIVLPLAAAGDWFIGLLPAERQNYYSRFVRPLLESGIQP